MSAPRSGSSARRDYAALVSAALTAVTGRVRLPGRRTPWLHTGVSADRVLLRFVWASLPAVALGWWSLGTAAGADGPVAAIAMGLARYLPLLSVALIASLCWEVLFARLLHRAVDAGWFVSAWLYVALLPPIVPPVVAAIGISFGVVFGGHVFGGTGRYLVSPALLGAVFVELAYPSLVDNTALLEQLGVAGTWARIAAEGADAFAASGTTWLSVFAGSELGAFGAPSAVLCLLGGAWLAGLGSVSWRTIAGGIGGLIIAAMLADALVPAAERVPWYWQLASGSFAFALAFVATDPSTMPLTRLARWLYGGLAGALTVLIRMANPDHPEATLYALLLAALLVPLIDHAVVARWRRRAGLGGDAADG